MKWLYPGEDNPDLDNDLAFIKELILGRPLSGKVGAVQNWVLHGVAVATHTYIYNYAYQASQCHIFIFCCTGLQKWKETLLLQGDYSTIQMANTDSALVCYTTKDWFGMACKTVDTASTSGRLSSTLKNGWFVLLV